MTPSLGRVAILTAVALLLGSLRLRSPAGIRDRGSPGTGRPLDGRIPELGCNASVYDIDGFNTKASVAADKLGKRVCCDIDICNCRLVADAYNASMSCAARPTGGPGNGGRHPPACRCSSRS